MIAVRITNLFLSFCTFYHSEQERIEGYFKEMIDKVGTHNSFNVHNYTAMYSD